MNPVSVELAALAADDDTASQAAKNAYTDFRTLEKKRFEKNPHAEIVLAKYVKDTDTWQKPLQELLVEAGADQDDSIVRQSQQVLKLVNPQQASQGKYNVQIGEGQGILIGEHSQVTQTFGEPYRGVAYDIVRLER